MPGAAVAFKDFRRQARNGIGMQVESEQCLIAMFEEVGHKLFAVHAADMLGHPDLCFSSGRFPWYLIYILATTADESNGVAKGKIRV
ncbi:MAG: hypothetical protein D3916_03455 [Candidatus Electrothrix sp. MAN1_4]|nr:hypothetical protein [Candidatus Electrothrix sp. MAN1_4]